MKLNYPTFRIYLDIYCIFQFVIIYIVLIKYNKLEGKNYNFYFSMETMNLRTLFIIIKI